jgi:glycosyltransferase involved in cell wall biosynthesis
MNASTILLISPERWGQNFVSKHHYAVHLAQKGCDVYFLNPPSAIMSSGSVKLTSTGVAGVHQINHSLMFKGLRLLPSALQLLIMRKRFKKIFRTIGKIPQVVWSFDPSILFNFKALNADTKSILHIVDLTQTFNLKTATKSADFCIANSYPIERAMRSHVESVIRISHGYAKKEHLMKKDVMLPGQSTIKAVYIGNLAIKYLDWQLVKSLTTQFKNVDFVFIGPKENSNLSKSGLSSYIEEDLIESENFFFHPPVPSKDIAFYLQQADVLLVCYKYQEYPEQLANPHKLMEYLASGKPVIATYTKEYEGKSFLPMAKTTDEFLNLFRTFVNGDLKYASKEATDFANDNTYVKQIAKIESITKINFVPHTNQI